MHPLFKQAIYNNRWLWSHILLGGLIAKILTTWFAPNQVLLIIMIGAILYEVFQWITGEHRNILDATLDVLGALLMATIIVW